MVIWEEREREGSGWLEAKIFGEKLFVICLLRRFLSNGGGWSFGPQGAAAEFFYLPWFSAWKWSDLIGCNETDQPPPGTGCKGSHSFRGFRSVDRNTQMKFPRFIGTRREKKILEKCLRIARGCRGLGTIGLSVLNNCYLDGKLTKSARQLGLLAPLPLPFLFLFHPLVRPLRKQPIRPVRALKT